MICNLKLAKQDCVAMDDIEALYAVFIKVEKFSGLLYKFKHTHQWKGEKLSNILNQVDKILHQILKKNAWALK